MHSQGSELHQVKDDGKIWISQLGLLGDIMDNPKISREVSPLRTLFALLKLTSISLVLSQS